MMVYYRIPTFIPSSLSCIPCNLSASLTVDPVALPPVALPRFAKANAESKRKMSEGNFIS
jgi:hypothetical protein